ncbi:MAG: hypothetical protein AABX37_00210, partial [Nanoarchaeota archaeon]
KSWMDTSACGLKLPNFVPGVMGIANISFNFKANFSQPETSMEILNYGFDNCDIVFNGTNVFFQTECTATIADLDATGWKRMSITNWHITKPNEVVSLFISPPTGFSDGAMIFDDLKVTLPS